ncbi:MAG: hypothetical protein FWE16_03000 [Firmicutes bacterium]|nr:hypothetical protein [Bacillota bacterium]
MTVEKKLEELNEDSLFILVLIPKLVGFSCANPYEKEICGRSMETWLDNTLFGYRYRKVDVRENDDIVSLVKKYSGEYQYTMVVYADMPLLTKETIEQAYGMVSAFGHKAVRMPRGWIFDTEYVRGGGKIEIVELPELDEDDFVAVYNYSQLARAIKITRARINTLHAENGVLINDPDTVHIDADVQIERDVIIEDNVRLEGRTVIKQGTRIGRGCTIISSTINASQLHGAKVESGSVVGPYAHLRIGTHIGENCRIGNFVEIKNSTIGNGTKISHLSYVGDAIVGRDCNIGCGVVFCNYDGEKKNQTIVGDEVFIGSNSNLVAPIIVENRAFIAAGSTITASVPPNALAIARARQENKLGWREGVSTESEAKAAPKTVIAPVKTEEVAEQVIVEKINVVKEVVDLDKIIEASYHAEVEESVAEEPEPEVEFGKVEVKESLIMQEARRARGQTMVPIVEEDDEEEEIEEELALVIEDKKEEIAEEEIQEETEDEEIEEEIEADEEIEVEIEESVVVKMPEPVIEKSQIVEEVEEDDEIDEEVEAEIEEIEEQEEDEEEIIVEKIVEVKYERKSKIRESEPVAQELEEESVSVVEEKIKEVKEKEQIEEKVEEKKQEDSEEKTEEAEEESEEEESEEDEEQDGEDDIYDEEDEYEEDEEEEKFKPSTDGSGYDWDNPDEDLEEFYQGRE